jgi:hypothetical protein
MNPGALRIHLRQRLRRTGNAPYLLDASTLLQNALASLMPIGTLGIFAVRFALNESGSPARTSLIA